MATQSGSGRAARLWGRAPASLLALSLLLAGTGIYQKASKAVAPPIYDPMAYYEKGAFCWRGMHHGRFNLLNIQPSIRPPGTLLVSAPFGFSPDFRQFFFRAIYYPILFFVAGFWLLCESQLTGAQQRWLNLGVALGLASLPMFYHFERNPNLASSYDWGYVDCLVAALAALSVALLIVSARRKKISLAMLGAIVAAFTLMVKPVGLLLMPLAFFQWFVELLITHSPLRTAWRNDRQLRRYTIVTAGFQCAAYASVMFASFGSQYLSKTNLTIGWNGQKMLIQMFASVPILTLIKVQLHYSIGWHWAVILLAVFVARVIMAIARMLQQRPLPADFRLAGALVGLCAGVTWWIVAAGTPQIRYVYPFVLVFLAVTIPDILAAASRLPRVLRSGIGIMCVVPYGLIMFLLFANPPPISWQSLAGVNLSAGQFQGDVKLGNFLLQECRKSGHELEIYTLLAEQDAGVIEAVGQYARLLDARAPSFRMRRPLDWIRPTMVRRDQITSADFLLLRQIDNPARTSAALSLPCVESVAAEAEVIEVWLTHLSEADGVQTVAAADSLRILKITEPSKLDEAFVRLIDQHQWRDLFLSENRDAVRFKMSKLFAESGETLLSITAAANVAALKPLHQLSVSVEQRDIVLRSSGSDPYLELPPIQLPAAGRTILHVRLSSPVTTEFQVFYATPQAPAYDQARTLEAKLRQGENDLYLEIPVHGCEIRLRVDPGEASGDYILHDLQLRAVEE
jgi:hypothetical protein